MKRQLLILLLGILILVSVSQAGTIDAAASSQQKNRLNAGHINENGAYASPLAISGAVTEGNGSPINRAGTIPTALVVNANITTVHVGDTVTANGTLINKNTGEGIPGATIMLQVSFDGNSWTTVARVRTDSNGSISYTGTIPDPRSFGYQVPLTVYGKVIFAGDEMYAGTASTYGVTVLPASP
jgi:hypothetical protein